MCRIRRMRVTPRAPSLSASAPGCMTWRNWSWWNWWSRRGGYRSSSGTRRRTRRGCRTEETHGRREEMRRRMWTTFVLTSSKSPWRRIIRMGGIPTYGRRKYLAHDRLTSPWSLAASHFEPLQWGSSRVSVKWMRRQKKRAWPPAFVSRHAVFPFDLLRTHKPFGCTYPSFLRTQKALGFVTGGKRNGYFFTLMR